MVRPRISFLSACFRGRRVPVYAALTIGLATLLQVAPAAAHGRRGGYFLGGVVAGAAFSAPRYYYPPPVYQYPPLRPYYPPPVVYVPAPAVVAPPQVVYTAPPVSYPPPPAFIAPPLSFEERLVRLKNLCEQGLIPDDECRFKREQILREM